MPLLPIVERELRIASRRRATYWTRAAIVVMATVVGIVTYLMSVVMPVSKFGQLLFWGLSGMSMVYCLVAGRQMTADCLSEEKREGTFGLLFLTDLKGYDVVMGKLAARSFNGFYGLVATVPVLAIPLLVGGMTYGEFWRMVLVLIDTFLLSLAVGMFASSTSRDYQHAMGRNFAGLLLATALLPACAAMLLAVRPGRPLVVELLFPCPVYAFFLCADAAYTKAPLQFWLSAGTIHFLTWVVIVLACFIAPESWQDKPSVPRAVADKKRKRWQWWREATAERRNAFRKRLLDQNAYYWLAGRPSVKPAWVWTLLVMLACWVARTAYAVGRLEGMVCLAGAVLANSSLKLWIALEASQQLAADQKSGAFELLLSTPLTSGEILRGQLMALVRQFLKPLIVVIAAEVIFILLLIRPQTLYTIGFEATPTKVVLVWTAGIIMLAADAVALSVVGMAAALTAKSYAHASMGTVRTILVIPWILYGFAMLIPQLLLEWAPRFGFSPAWEYELAMYFGLGIGIDFLCGWRAWRRLRANFRDMALPGHGDAGPGSLKTWRDGALSLVEIAWPQLQPGDVHSRKRRRLTFALAGGIALCGCFPWVREALRDPMANCPVVKLGPAKTELRIASTQDGLLFVLPDGSLWKWGKFGATSIHRAATPERIGTNSDWVDACCTANDVFTLRGDGTVWSWIRGTEFQVENGSDCAAIAAGSDWLAMLKRDGSLWGLSNNARRPLGLSSGWKEIRGNGFSMIGLRQDGTLWIWGKVPIFSGFSSTTTNLPGPVQVCSATNWTGLGSGLPLVARDDAGASWSVQVLLATPSAQSPASFVLGKITAGLPFRSTAFGLDYAGSAPAPARYDVHPDGTLWTMPSSWWPQTPRRIENPRQFAKGRNWVSVWSDIRTGVAVTDDGTIWAWGPDWGQEPQQLRQSGLSVIRERLTLLMSPGPPMGGGSSGFAPWWQTYKIRKKPAPLLRMEQTPAITPSKQ